MIITYPNFDFYPSRIPDSGVKKLPDPGSGSATLMVRKMCGSLPFCAAEEEQLLDSVIDCGHGNWSDIGNTVSIRTIFSGCGSIIS
jgi:hypothetical protein